MIRHANQRLKFNPCLDCTTQQSLISANRLTLIRRLNLIHLRRKVNSLLGRLNLKQNGWRIFSSRKDAHEFIDTTIVYSLIAIKFFGLATDSAKGRFGSILLRASNAVRKSGPYKVQISSTFSINMVIFESDRLFFCGHLDLLSFFCRCHIGNLRERFIIGC